MIRASVAMAVYNGSPFIRDTLRSILQQLTEYDEIVIVDDMSTDQTATIIDSFDDTRIRLFRLSHNVGHVRAFEIALNQTCGSVVLLADQDDLWPPNRLNMLLSALSKSKSSLIASSFATFLDDANSTSLSHSNLQPVRISTNGNADSFVRFLFGKQPYFGCTFAMTSTFKDFVIPFPAFVEAHDHWLAVAALSQQSLTNLDQILLWRRLHARNLSPTKHRAYIRVVKTRLIMIWMYFFSIARRIYRGTTP